MDCADLNGFVLELPVYWTVKRGEKSKVDNPAEEMKWDYFQRKRKKNCLLMN